MKQFILTFLLLAFAIAGSYAWKVEHVVQRGETIEGIASKYGLTPQSVLTGNNVDRVYVGLKLEIEIPDAPKQNMHSNNMAQQFISPEEASLAKEAKYAFENKYYDKAVKHYDKLIKKYPSSAYYFNRGLAQFNRGKNRQAAKDFRQALKYPDCNSYIEEHALELIEVADARHQQWKEEKAQLWGSVIVGTLAVGAQTWANIEAAKAYEAVPVYNTTPTYSSYSSPTPVADAMENGWYFQNVYSGLMNVSLQQAQMQMEQERQQVFNSYMYQCKMTGVEPTQEGWNDFYTQYCVAMSQYLNANNNNNNNRSTNTHEQKKRATLNATYGEDCKLCGGSGRCNACGGNKIAHGMGQTYYCKVCDDSGNCPLCKGSGKTPWNR